MPDYPNGDKPVTQITRDQMAQSDHDKLVEYGVMLQNILSSQTRLEQQIKDLINGQATALASWEATSKAIDDALDSRIRKIEDLAVQYVPLAQQFEIRIKTLESGVQEFRDKKNEFLGGWKTIVFVGAIIAGVSGLALSIIDVFIRWPHH